jgi:hypothetical protein
MFSPLTLTISDEPLPPTPTQPMFRVSLGALRFLPPRTLLGTIITPAAAAAVRPMNWRRVRIVSGFVRSSWFGFM